MITGANFKSMFFDRKAITSKVDAASRRVLSKFGAFVRTTAKQSLRYGTKASAPGSPPTVHRNALYRRKKKNGVSRPTSPFKELIFFGYDDPRKSVLIGPAVFESTGGKATEVLEHGGTETIKLPDGSRATAHYEARPTMGPAAAKELPKLPGMWANSIKP